MQNLEKLKGQELVSAMEDRIAELWNSDELGANPAATIANTLAFEFELTTLPAASAHFRKVLMANERN